MLTIAITALMLGNGVQQYSCPEYIAEVTKVIQARYAKPYLSPPEAKAFEGKICKVLVETNQYGNVVKVAPTDCSPMEIQAANRTLVGVVFPVQQAPGCAPASLNLSMPKQ